MKQLIVSYSLGVASIVGGAFLGKLVSQEAGMALIAAGGWWLGKIQRQPDFAARRALPPGGEEAGAGEGP